MPPTRWLRPPTRIRHFAGVFTLYNAGSPSLYADIDREKAEKVGLTPTDVFSTLQLYLGSQIRERLQLSRPHLPGACAREMQRSAERAETSRDSRSAMPAARWCRSVRSRPSTTRPLPIACRAIISTLPPRSWAPPRPGVASGTAMERMAALAKEVLAARLRLRMDRPRASAGAAGHHRPLLIFAASAVVRLPRAGGAIRKLEVAAGHRADRADVLAGLSDRPATSRGMPIDILAQIGFVVLVGLGREERDPDRGVRAAAAGP